MNKKNIFAGVLIVFVILFGVFYFKNREKSQPENAREAVLRETIEISKEYTRLSYQTDNVLVNAKNYKDYDDWNEEMTLILESWKTLESDAVTLGKNADKLANEKTSFNLVSDIYAYNSVEIQKVIESAPMGRQVRTLAQHLGVDAKRAQLILNESQDRVSREVWGGEGDVYQGLEQDAMRIKNGAKVTVFVGGVVLTGGLSAVATGGVVAKTALVVSGADLVLEVADDEAKIALGDKNKVSEMVGKMRTVTEPAASILSIVNMPGNVSKAMEKISAISFVGDQIRSVAQDEKILGISIKADEKGEVKAQVSGLTETELVEWKKEVDSSNVDQETKPAEDDKSQETATNSITGQEMAGTYSGSATLQNVEEDIEADDSLAVTLQLNEAGTGTANVYGFDGGAQYAGNNVSFSVSMKEGGVVVKAVFTGKASRNGNQTVISGNIRTVMMGVTVATYSWSAQK